MAFIFNKKQHKLELPISSRGHAKLSPKKKGANSAWSLPLKLKLRSPVGILFILCGFLYLLTRVFTEDGSGASYKSFTLEDKEYYDYEFKDVDVEAIRKYDSGAEHYLITKGGVEALSEADKATYDREVQMLLDSTVEEYDLSKYEGTSHGAENKEHVLMLIPLRNAENVLPLMFKNLMNLTYPHELIDVAFLVSDCSEGDNTLGALMEYSKELQNGTLSLLLADQEERNDKANPKGSQDLFLKYMKQEYLDKVREAFNPPFHENYDKPFRSIQIFQKDFGQIIGQGFSDRHAVTVQGIRRKLMGRARNWLTANALKPYHSWVYWRDADVELCPGSVIQDLMAMDYDVAVPNVWRPLPDFLGGEQAYDLNSWVESTEALKLAKNLDEDDVIVEGYAEYPTYRVHLAYIRNPNGDPTEVLPLDGVGGVSILAKAKLFRNGVHFPAFTFENHAETEAFGKMAKKMGYSVGGFPHYTLWHIYEPSDDDIKQIAAIERDSGRV